MRQIEIMKWTKQSSNEPPWTTAPEVASGSGGASNLRRDYELKRITMLSLNMEMIVQDPN